MLFLALGGPLVTGKSDAFRLGLPVWPSVLRIPSLNCIKFGTLGDMPTLLIVHHSPTPLLQEILAAVLEGARASELADMASADNPLEVRVVKALEATSEDVLAADAILLGTTANFGYISGALKHFFDTTFFDCLDHTKGLPFSYWIRGGKDTTGAENAMKSITTGYDWKLAAEPVVFVGSLDDGLREQLTNLGGTMAAQLL